MTRWACLYATLAMLALAWGLPSPVWTATARLPVGELVREADLVAVVHVMIVQDLPEMPLAIATLKMRDILKAPADFASESITVAFPSLRVPEGTSRRVFSIGPTYRPGEAAVVFLKEKPQAQHFETIRAQLGKRTITNDHVAYEEVTLDAFLGQIRAALSSFAGESP